MIADSIQRKKKYLLCTILIVFFMMQPGILFAQQEQSVLAWVNAKKDSNIISFKEYTVFDGNKGVAIGNITYRLACGPTFVALPDGELLCTWLSGSDSEPATDNCSLMSRSRDGGKTWSTPYIISPAGKMASSFGNMRVTSDGKLTAFVADWPADKQYTETYYSKTQSSDNGYTWSQPVPFSVNDKHNLLISRPVSLQNGALLYGSSFFEERPVPLKSPVRSLIDIKTEAGALAVRDTLRAGDLDPWKFGQYLHGVNVLYAENDTTTVLKQQGHISNRPLGLLEPTLMKLKNGTIVMLMRAEWGGFLWRAESKDNGKTWSKAWQTDIPNPTTLADLVRLPDGRIALLHNANGEKGKFGVRSPLSLWISNDEMNTWYIKADLLTGESHFAYPHGNIVNEKLLFAYDKNRREIKFVEVTIKK